MENVKEEKKESVIFWAVCGAVLATAFVMSLFGGRSESSGYETKYTEETTEE